MAERESRPGGPERVRAAEDFAAELRRLRREAGQPSFRTMARKAGSISHTTLYEAASGSRLPSWPTTRAYVQACGGDEAEWHRRWMSITDESPAADADTRPVVPPPAATPAESPVEPPTSRASGSTGLPLHRHRLWTHAVSLLVGTLLGACGTLGLVAFRGPVAQSALPQDCPVGDAATRRPAEPEAGSAAHPAPPGPFPATDRTATAGPAPSWVSRPAFDQQILSGTDVVLPVLSPVTRGDALIVTMMLTSTCPGKVTVTDTQGDRFGIVGDVTDSLRHRVLVLAAFGVPALTTADAIHVSYPHSSKYHVAVDEFRGVSAARGSAHASGESGGTAFTTSAGPLDCTAGDLLVGTVGTNTGTAPEFSPGWTTLPVLRLSSYRLTTAHQVATDSGRCAATGQTTAQWGAVLAAFH
ncbi:helix-turn-helix domain-containing protein [Kitasatospora sp. RG8]|nr:helix-turn-helix domain-containing protein [Kitasatospora sp. RG8]